MRFLNARPPYTVLAFASFVTLIFLVSLAREGPHERLIYGGLLLLAATFGLLQGAWVAWLFLAFVALGDVIVALYRWPDRPVALTIAINGVMLVLLLAGSTRRYTRRGRPRVLRKLGFGRPT
jgi:hypothetical protein